MFSTFLSFKKGSAMHLLIDDLGNSLLQHALVAVFVSVIAVTIMQQLGVDILGMFEGIANSFPAWVS